MLTKEEAQRLSRDDLLRVGRFYLRLLATELGLFRVEDAKMAFMSMTNEDQTDLVYAELHRKENVLLAEMRAAVEDYSQWFYQTAAIVRSTHLYYRKRPTKMKAKRSKR